MTLPILAMTNLIIDDLWLADGTHHPATLGGAVVYAATAAAFWWPEVAMITGVGSDLEKVTRGRLRDFGLRTEGEIVRDKHTIQSRLVYFEDGERTETPAYGPDHFAGMELTPDEIPAALLPAAGTYIFRNLWPEFWASYETRRGDLGTTLWELQGDVAEIRHWPAIRAILPSVDIFSLNLTEARGILGIDDPDAILRELNRAGARTVVLRMGGEGALIGDAHRQLRLRPPPTPVIDVTGGGNAFCGGFLAGWCLKPGDLEHAARCAAASAARALAQYGPANPRERAGLAALAATTEIDRREASPALSFNETSSR
ncbi:carbohydrate kinase family protein [Kaistia dalseonensis]|uniref:Sugar/nucleoside kinase (Ribokinase family) n=1 Tax=Kaistia dalseonensis TaxID=410840 RepID=A0ABU0H490_9HYPH|nr:carbohydrate kinase family protein [Kaistia dalseonensis]MCX5494022.1 carbohydrate kinase family protein [Kaistia dalseonensis]MDQ0436600.1 sugar/nucleoside kinase (ribokinase family) [Kaistia dalseonensis]